MIISVPMVAPFEIYVSYEQKYGWFLKRGFWAFTGIDHLGLSPSSCPQKHPTYGTDNLGDLILYMF